MDYIEPVHLDDALEALAHFEGGARVLAGGQSLLPLLANDRVQIDMLIALERIEELRGVQVSAERIRCGAMCRQADVEQNAAVCRAAPLLLQIARHIGPDEVRNRGTVCGSLALAHPCAAWPAVAVALNATIAVASRARRRVIPAADFFRGPWQTALEPGELVEAMSLAPQSPSSAWAIRTFRHSALEYPVAGVLVVTPSVGAGRTVVTSFGRGLRIQQTEIPEAIAGAPARHIRDAAIAASRGVCIGSDNGTSVATRRAILEALTTRALNDAAAAAERAAHV